MQLVHGSIRDVSYTSAAKKSIHLIEDLMFLDPSLVDMPLGSDAPNIHGKPTFVYTSYTMEDMLTAALLYQVNMDNLIIVPQWSITDDKVRYDPLLQNAFHKRCNELSLPKIVQELPGGRKDVDVFDMSKFQGTVQSTGQEIILVVLSKSALENYARSKGIPNQVINLLNETEMWSLYEHGGEFKVQMGVKPELS